MWIKLTPNECVERAMQAASKSHERSFWFELASLMIEVDKPIVHSPQYAEGGLTLPTGRLYFREARISHREKMERIQRYGTNY